MGTLNSLTAYAGLNPIVDTESSTGNTTYTLPTGANIQPSQRVRVINTSTTTGIVTVQASDSTVVGYVYPSTDREFLSLQANPTNSAHWSMQSKVKAPTQTILQMPIYQFTIPSSTVAAGLTYTNNGFLFQTIASVTSSTTVLLISMQGGAPTASGTLTSVGPQGSNLSFSASALVSGASSGTYTPPQGATWLRVRMVGGGGGGAGGGAATPSNGSGGGNTTFGTATAGGGAGGVWDTVGALGGTPTLTGLSGFGLVGGIGGMGTANASVSTTYVIGGMGGVSALGGTASISVNTNGGTAIANSGSGGNGGPCSLSGASTAGGAGGGAGAYVDGVITGPAASYSYSLGSAGANGGGNPGTGFNGGYGANGIIIVEEHYSG